MPRRHYGWTGQVTARETPNPADRHFMVSPHAALPANSDLSSEWGARPVFDQGQLGSCGPNSAAGDIIAAYLPHGQDYQPSRLFIYWMTRYLMGTVNQDSGVDNRTLLQALHTYGWCDEAMCPYVIGHFTVKPSPAAIQQAGTRTIDAYLKVPQDLDQMRGCLAGGDPFIFGFTCYPGLESAQAARTGIIPMPGRGERPIGGHDIVFCGYDDARRLFKFRNSWGTSWGEDGYGWMPYDYATNPQLAGDFWTVRYPTIDPPQPVPPVPPAPPVPAPPGPVTPYVIASQAPDGSEIVLHRAVQALRIAG